MLLHSLNKGGDALFTRCFGNHQTFIGGVHWNPRSLKNANPGTNRQQRLAVAKLIAHILQRQPIVAQCVRSEEHTSELQSLMRISYAVFCLKTKNKYNLRQITYTVTK